MCTRKSVCFLGVLCVVFVCVYCVHVCLSAVLCCAVLCGVQEHLPDAVIIEPNSILTGHVPLPTASQASEIRIVYTGECVCGVRRVHASLRIAVWFVCVSVCVVCT